MNTLEHVVTPEDVMAFVDGELSAADAQVVREHLEHCAECALLVQQLRETSEMLERWEVEAVPSAVEEAVASKADGINGWPKKLFGRLSWKLAVFAGGGAVVAAMLMVSVLTRPRIGHTSQMYVMDGQPAPEPAAVAPSPAAPYRTGPGMGTRLPNERDRLLAFEERKQRAAMSESLVSNGALADKVVGGIVGGKPTTDQMSKVNGQPGPMIARAASLVIVVKNIDSARAAMDAIVERYQGYPASLNANAPEDGPRNVSSSLRIPAATLNAAIGELKSLGRVAIETQSGEDVSQQHEDLVARLKTSRETEARFQAILAERTGRLSDVLEVEENIARVRGEIEAMEAEQRSMEHRVDFATIEIQLVEVYKAKLQSPASDSVGTRLHNAFVAGYHHAADTVLGLVLFVEEFVPMLLIWAAILGVPCVMIWRLYKKMRTRMEL